MKTTKEYFEQLFHMIDEWRPCERQAKEVEALIATIQKEAFECGQKDISDDIIKTVCASTTLT